MHVKTHTTLINIVSKKGEKKRKENFILLNKIKEKKYYSVKIEIIFVFKFVTTFHLISYFLIYKNEKKKYIGIDRMLNYEQIN